jgi:hypothetical protein
MKIWQQPSWIKWIVYIVVVYILFLIKEALAVILCVLFAVLLYYIIFAKNIFKTTSFYEKQ